MESISNWGVAWKRANWERICQKFHTIDHPKAHQDWEETPPKARFEGDNARSARKNAKSDGDDARSTRKNTISI